MTNFCLFHFETTETLVFFQHFDNLVYMAATKNKRQIEVFLSLMKFQRARPHDITQKVARVLGADENDPAFKRAIHRDLRSLLENHQVAVDYFTPSGDPIPPGEEDTHSNLRVEYYILQQAIHQVRGGSLFSDIGGDIVCPKYLYDVIHFEENPSQIPKNSYQISLEVRRGQFIHLWFSKEDRPLKVYFCRKTVSANEEKEKQEILEILENRSIIVYVPDRSVSRFKNDTIQAHAQISFLREEERVKIVDQGSSKGTYISSEEFKTLDFEKTDSNDLTVEAQTPQVSWSQIEKIESTLPSNLKLGQFHLYIKST